MTVEQRLRELWRSSDGDLEIAGDDGLARIERKVAAAERERRRRRLAGGVVGVAAAAFAGVGALVLVDDGDSQQVGTGPVAAESSSSMATTTEAPPDTRPATTAPPAEEPDPYVWTGEAASPGGAASAFLQQLVGMATTIVVDERRSDDLSFGVEAWEVDVIPREDLRQFVTTVRVHREEHDGLAYYGVSGSTSPNIELTSPRPGERIASPIRPIADARAFEGTVQVTVAEDGGRVLGEGFVTGSGDATPRPVHGEVAFDDPAEDTGALALYTASAEDGRVLEATVVRVGFARCGPFDPEPPGEGGRVVLVHFLCGDAASPHVGVVGVPRRIGEGSGVLAAAMAEQLEGPSATERDGGLFSQLDEGSAGLLRGVTIADGTAVVDFEDDLVAALEHVGTSAGGIGFLDQLDATAFQFPTVERVEYRLGGSCQAFYEWLQGGCEVRERPAG